MVDRSVRHFTARRRFLSSGVAAISSIGIISGPVKAAQFEFKCGSDNAVDHPSSIRQRQMWAAVEQESGGRIHTEFFPNSQLGGTAAMLTQLRVGALPFCLVSPGVLSGVVPLADINYLGFAFRDPEEGFRVLDGPLGAYVRQQTESKGLHAFPLCWHSGMYVIGVNPRPIRVPDDLHGLKLRVIEGRITLDLFKTLGANPVPMSASEIYTALQTKIVDGETLSLAAIEANHFFEVNKFVSLTNHAFVAIWFLANNDVWKSLPRDLQAIVERNAAKYATLERQDVLSDYATLAPKLTSQGTTVNSVDQTPFRALLRPYYARWAAEFGPTVWTSLQRALGRNLI